MSLKYEDITSIFSRICLFCLGMVLIFAPFSKRYTLLFLRPAVILWTFSTLFFLFRKKKIELPSLWKLLVIFFMGVFISLFFSTDFYYSQKLFFYRFSLFLILPFVCAFCINKMRDIKFLFFALLIGISIVGIDVLFQYFTGFDFINKYKVAKEIAGNSSVALLGPFGWYTQLGAYAAAVSVMLVCFLVFSKQNIYCKILITILLLLSFFSLIFSLARGAWGAFVISFFIIFFLTAWFNKKFRDKKVLMNFLFFIFVIFFAFLLAYNLSSGVKTRIDTFFEGNAFLGGRDVVWEESISLIITHPLFGVGLYRAPFVTSFKGDAHNAYLNILLETGILGFIPFILIVFIYLKKMISFFINIRDIDTNIYILSFFFICLTFFINDLKEATINGGWDLGILFWSSLGISLRGVDLSLKEDYERKD